MPRMEWLIGVDLGQSQDYTAIVAAERRPVAGQQECLYDMAHVERLPLGTSYVDVVPRVRAIETRLRGLQGDRDLEQDGRAVGRAPAIALVVDQTGVGAAVTDALRAAGLNPECVTITGGDAVHRGGGRYRVPKRELVGALRVVLEDRRIRIAPSSAEAAVLKGELRNFKAKIKLSTGHDTYGAGEEWREAAHDDLVLAAAMVAWYGEKELGERMSFADLAPYVRDTPMAIG